MRSDGEIAPIDAEPLSKQTGVAAKETEPQTIFGAPDDDRAINNMLVKLRQSSKHSLTEEEEQDQAIDLYNMICKKIRSGNADSAFLNKAAGLFDEDPDALAERLDESS